MIAAIYARKSRVVRVDDVGLVARVGAVAAEFRTTLKQGGPPARRLLAPAP